MVREQQLISSRACSYSLRQWRSSRRGYPAVRPCEDAAWGDAAWGDAVRLRPRLFRCCWP